MHLKQTFLGFILEVLHEAEYTHETGNYRYLTVPGMKSTNKRDNTVERNQIVITKRI